MKIPSPSLPSAAGWACRSPEVRAELPAEARAGWSSGAAPAAGTCARRRRWAGSAPGDYVQRRVGAVPYRCCCWGTVAAAWCWPSASSGSAGRPRPLHGRAAAGAVFEPACARTLTRGRHRDGRSARAARAVPAPTSCWTDGGGFHLLEINARPGASLEAAELALGMPLVGLHIAACRGRLPEPAAAGRGRGRAREIVWADRDLRVPDWLRLAGLGRRPDAARHRALAGQPLATVRAHGRDARRPRALC